MENTINNKNNIIFYEDDELSKSLTCSILEQVQKEVVRTVKKKHYYYNLDMVLKDVME